MDKWWDQDLNLFIMTPYGQMQTQIEESRQTTRPSRYDLNQISNDYTVEVTDRLKKLGLTDREPDWTMDRSSWHWTADREQDQHQENEMQKSKMTVWGGLTNSCEKKRSKKQRRKGKTYPFEYRVPKNNKER